MIARLKGWRNDLLRKYGQFSGLILDCSRNSIKMKESLFFSWLLPMPLQSLNQVLHTFQNQPLWHEQRQFQLLLASWQEIVGPAVGAQTQPLSISRQRVLQVAASSGVWAQNLAFERHLILKKLNLRLQPPLIDIQFSTRQWQSLRSKAAKPSSPRQAHPSHLPNSAGRKTAPAAPAGDPQTAFRRWAHTIQERSRQLPLCPQCRCPTPPGELQRWQICSLCAVKTLGSKKPSP